MSTFIRQDEPVLIWTGKSMLDGVLTVPHGADALVVMPGLGGTFHHDRIRSIARHFQNAGFATLIADLLTADEQQFDARTGHFRVDTPLLASRIRDIAAWMADEYPAAGLPVALFAGKTTAAACIEAARDLAPFALLLIEPDRETVTYDLPEIEAPVLVVTIRDAGAEAIARQSLPWLREQVPVAVA